MKASWTAHPDQEIFITSQHGLLGFARSTKPVLTLNGIRISTVQSTSPPGNVAFTYPSRFATTREVGPALITRWPRQDTATQT